MLEGIEILWIGGSPCSGKSTISKMLINEFGFDYYECDYHLNRYVEIGAAEGKALMVKLKAMNKDQIWLRDINEQVEEEFEFYRIALETIVEDLKKNFYGKKVLVQGAAILPMFIKENKIRKENYICIAPTREFQIENFAKREWVKGYLSDCSNPEKAFENWMERDVIYAKRVIDYAKENNMNYLVVDGSKTIDDNYKEVKRAFAI